MYTYRLAHKSFRGSLQNSCFCSCCIGHQVSVSGQTEMSARKADMMLLIMKMCTKRLLAQRKHINYSHFTHTHVHKGCDVKCLHIYRPYLRNLFMYCYVCIFIDIYRWLYNFIDGLNRQRVSIYYNSNSLTAQSLYRYALSEMSLQRQGDDIEDY